MGDDKSSSGYSCCGGGLIGNVNRWRGQVGLEAVGEGDLASMSQEVEMGDGGGVMFDILGQAREDQPPLQMLAAIRRREGIAWFVKMTGTCAKLPDSISS